MDLSDLILSLPATNTLKNEICLNHTLKILEHATFGTPWALSMLDASSKVPSGLLEGNFVDLGNFDECINVKVNEEWGSFKGQHCLATANVDIEEHKDIPLTWSVCIPSTCQPSDLSNFFTTALNYSIEVKSSNCHTQDPKPFVFEDWLAIFIIGLFSLICIFGTLLDVYVSDPKKRNPYLIAFSWYTNGKQLFNTKNQSRDVIACLHGVRFFSAMMILGGHTYFIRLVTPTVNKKTFQKAISDWAHTAVALSVNSVETFFLLSGLLLGYLFLKSMEKGKKFNLPLFYLFRYIRLTPVLAVVVLIHTGLIMHLGSGPIYESGLEWHPKVCKKNWWATLLYILNYVHREEMCMTVAWFLAVDTQLYLMSPVLLLMLLKRPRFGVILIQVLTVASIAATFMEPYLRDKVTTYQDSGRAISPDYFYTHTRASSWLIGISLSYTLYKTRSWREAILSGTASGIPKKYVLGGWIGAVICLSITVIWSHRFLQEKFEPSLLEFCSYTAFVRPLWCLAIAWIIFACMMGNGGVLNAFLSWEFFIPLSRLTYSFYIIHYPYLLVKIFSNKTATYFNDFTELFDIDGSIVMVTLLSIPMYLMFESPTMIIMKTFFEDEKKLKDQIQPNITESSKAHKIDIFNNNGAGSCISRRQPFPSNFNVSEEKTI